MPARTTQSADDTPKRTPSFVSEVPLRVSRTQERMLLARLEAARQVYNACLGQACARVRLVRESKAFHHARTLPRDDPERKRLFAQARTRHAFSEYGLHAYAKQYGSSWLGEQRDESHDPKAGVTGVWSRQPTAVGQSPQSALQRQASA